MRLDKFLKVSRVIKRRTLAKEVCDAGKILINGRPAKAGTEVKPQDELSLDFGTRVLKVRVLDTPKTASTEEAKKMYEEI
ncbi:MAG: RNA-binding protein [Desulfitibacter sp. BRH_c19]|nr:MAG: RNA-binding protein [Desulfitibacter sp. BRH_c19]